MPPHFTTLPREIRDAILEICLVVGVINPHSAQDPFEKSTRKPDISLLAVNKTINAEAAEIFFRKNVWVLKRSFKHEPVDDFWHIHRNQIRHVHMSLNPDKSKVGLWSLALDKAYQTSPEKTSTISLVESAAKHRVSLIIEASRWKINFCRELGIHSLTIDLPSYFDTTFSASGKALWLCCLEPLLDWVQNDEETRIGEPNPASGRSYPKITLTGRSDIMIGVCLGWEEQWGPLNHFVKGHLHRLEGFFQRRGAKTMGKTLNVWPEYRARTCRFEVPVQPENLDFKWCCGGEEDGAGTQSNILTPAGSFGNGCEGD